MLHDFINKARNLVAVKNMTQKVWTMIELTTSPFMADILTEELLADFHMPDLPRYEGKTDPFHYIQQYLMWMAVKRHSRVILCQEFSLTLGRPAFKWFGNLRPISIAATILHHSLQQHPRENA